MEKLKLLDLFSGLGGMSLGLEKTGHFKTVAFCEWDNDCRKVLEHYWPGVHCFGDINQLTTTHIYDGEDYLGEGKTQIHHKDIDVMAGGFSCQDVSKAKNKKTRKGVEGERSGVWKQYARLIGEVRPRYAIIENVEFLRKNGLGIVLNDLAKLGFNAEWGVFPATSVGLPHQRERLFIVAYRNSVGQQITHSGEGSPLQADQKRKGEGLQEVGAQRESESGHVRQVFSRGAVESVLNSFPDRGAAIRSLRRVADGVPEGISEQLRQKRIHQLGNSVVPLIPQAIGMLILKHMGRI